jgi:hypothetical protein
MWHRGQVVLSVVLFLVGQIVIAQNCQALLNHGLYNIEIKTSQDDVSQNLFNQLCSESFSLDSLSESKVKSFGASLSYAGFGIGGSSSGGSSKEQVKVARDQFCSTMSSQASSNVQVSSEVRTLFPEALTTFERCLELEAKGLHIDVQIQPSSQAAKTIVYGLTSTTPGSLKLTGVNIDPAGTFTCTGKTEIGGSLVEFNGDTETSLSTNQVNFVCTRNQQNGVYEAATISVLTNDENLSTYFARVPLLPELQNTKANELETQLSIVQNDINILRTNLGGLRIIVLKTTTDGEGMFSIAHNIQNYDSIVGATFAINRYAAIGDDQAPGDRGNYLWWDEQYVRGGIQSGPDFGSQPVSVTLFVKE